MSDLDEFGFVFIYVFAFGISDFIVKKFIRSDVAYLLYYLFIGIVGLTMIFVVFKKTSKIPQKVITF